MCSEHELSLAFIPTSVCSFIRSVLLTIASLQFQNATRFFVHFSDQSFVGGERGQFGCLTVAGIDTTRCVRDE